MVDPIIIAAGIAAATALAQLYMAEKARGGESGRLKDLQKRFDQIVSPEYNLKITDAPKLIQARLQGHELAPMKFSREEAHILKEYNPQLYATILEQQPELMKETQQTAPAKNFQLAALKKFMDVGEGGFDPIFQQQLNEALHKVRSHEKASNELLSSQYHQRGLQNSGLEYAAKQKSKYGSMDALALASGDAAANARRNQLHALAQGSGLAGNIRGDEYRDQAFNLNAVNDFNQRLSTRGWEQEKANKELANNAQKFNLGEGQRLHENTVDQRNKAGIDTLKYNNDVNAQKYGRDFDERNYLNGINTAVANGEQGRIDKENSMKDKMFQNELQKTQGAAGLSNQMGANNIGNSQDRIGALGGFGQIGSGLFTHYAGQEAQKEKEAREDARRNKFYEKWNY